MVQTEDVFVNLPSINVYYNEFYKYKNSMILLNIFLIKKGTQKIIT